MRDWIKFILKYPICFIRGHELDEKHFINTMQPGLNYMKRCKCCGFYFMHGEIGAVMVSPKEAKKFRKEFYETFPKMKPEEDGE